MKLKRYIAPDMRQALKMIRDELGPDAVILSNKRVNNGIEIMVAEDYDAAALPEVAAEQTRVAPEMPNGVAAAPADTSVDSGHEADSGQAQIDATFEHLLGQYKQAVPANPDHELMQSMRSEIENLRLLLKQQLNQMSSDSWILKNPQQAEVVRRFRQLGFNEQLAQRFASRVTDQATIEDAWRAALLELASMLDVTGPDSLLEPGRVALLGPTGAGKTTTVAKLAIRYVLRHGRENLALVTTDNQRLAAYDQLRTLARIIDVPVRRVDEQNSLAAVLRSLRDKSLILIDMPGCQSHSRVSPQSGQHKDRGDNWPEQPSQLLQALSDKGLPAIKKFLVLPCTSQPAVLQSAYDIASTLGINGCILSKADEAASFGEVMSLVLAKDLPVAYITNGQTIPEDIEVATASGLLRYMLESADVLLSASNIELDTAGFGERAGKGTRNDARDKDGDLSVGRKRVSTGDSLAPRRRRAKAPGRDQATAPPADVSGSVSPKRIRNQTHRAAMRAGV